MSAVKAVIPTLDRTYGISVTWRAGFYHDLSNCFTSTTGDQLLGLNFETCSSRF